jgi:hypothetical protein
MRNLEPLIPFGTQDLRQERVRLDHIYRHAATPEHVRKAAVVLLNFYGAELDARMTQQEGSK